MFDWNKVDLVNYSVFAPSGQFNQQVQNRTLEDQIEYIARVSNPGSQQGEHAEPGRLTKYLIRNKHWSPLEMVSVCLEINTTRDIARQILRHRSFHFQEFSQRYAEVGELGGYVKKQARSQDSKNRQASHDNMDMNDKIWFNNVQDSVYQHVWQQYIAALERGVAKEVARSFLPEGMTPSRLYMAGTVRDWYHYVALRTSNGTQLEHQDVANKCLTELHELMPNIFSEENINDG